MNNVVNIIGVAAGLYEVLARAIPTKKNWSIVHKVFKTLVTISGFLNRGKAADEKPGISTPTVTPLILCVVCATTFLSCSAIKQTKFECLSKKEVHITLIDKNGNPYTFHSTYCDSIRVDTLPDSTKVKQ